LRNLPPTELGLWHRRISVVEGWLGEGQEEAVVCSAEGEVRLLATGFEEGDAGCGVGGGEAVG
jgi:hypothetical protein